MTAVETRPDIAPGISPETIGELAHDLRSPLTAIYGHAQFMMRLLGRPDIGIAPDISIKLTSSLQVILEQAQRANGQINTALVLTRQGREGLTEKTTPVSVIFDDYSRAMSPELAGKGIELIIIPQTQVPQVPAGINEVVCAMANNGIDAIEKTAERGILTLSCKTLNDAVTITITDTGTGISREDLPKIGTGYSTNTGERGFGVSDAIKKLRPLGGKMLFTSRGVTMDMGTHETIAENPAQADRCGTVVTIILPLN